VDREQILAALQAIIDEADGRALTDDEVQRYEQLEGELQAIDRDVQVRSRQRAYTTPAPGSRVETAAGGEGDGELQRAFDAYLRTGIAPADLAELRAHETGTPSEGGYLVPTGFLQKLTERMVAFGGVANAVETLNTSSGNPLEWPTVDDTANVGEIVAEEGTFAAGADVTFGQVTLGAYKYMSGGAGNEPIRVSVELLQDSAFDIGAFLSRAMGVRIARAQSAHFVTGNGSGQPKGLIHGKTGIEIAADTAGIEYADLVTFVHSVDPDYRPGAVWAFNDSTLATIRKLEDLNGRPLWMPSDAGLEGAMPGGSLLGFPVVIDQAFPDVDPDNNTVNWGAFGNLREGYIVRRVQAVQVIVDPYSRAKYGQVEYTAWARADGNVQNPNAYVALTGEQ